AFVYLAETIKEKVKVPVITCNRINDPGLADEIIRQGKADFVAMGRAFIADPHLPRKAFEGGFTDINTCVGCNQGCLDNIFSGNPNACLVNPEAGRERELAVKAAPRSKKVLVIGGGPAGLEAARVAAARGHAVSLYEKTNCLGGQLNLAAVIPGKGEFAGLVRNLSYQAINQGVNIVLGKEVTSGLVESLRPDTVIVATGSSPTLPEIPGIQGANVVHANDVLSGKVEVGRRVVVIGARGTGCDVSLFIAKRGAATAEAALFLTRAGTLEATRTLPTAAKSMQVTLMRRTGRIADDLGRSVRWIVLQELNDAGVRTIAGLEYEEINEQGVVIRKDGLSQLIEADTVVIATGREPVADLFAALGEKVPELHLIGDAKQVRDALAAIYEGAIAGRAV
ncbi:MAG: FAD-dependent oxidoreductase, partial [Dehalococcoidia bacterium]|nr:FAD-dependent oxidoreductase [Dehalococcoidia bacterium]